MLVLGIESSCDETAAAVVRDGREVLSSVVASQHELHAEYGGVVPEIASRAHVERITPVIDAALRQAGVTLRDINAVAVGNRPGLIGALLVGVSAGKALAWSLGVPLIGVDHVRAHLYAGLLDGHPAGDACFPAIGLVVSGGHTALFHLDSALEVTRLGGTIDDAAGEAFDKCAAMLALGHPGGPLVDRLASTGNDRAHDFPVSLLAEDSLDFSFSGVKTSALYAIRGQPQVRGTQGPVWSRDASNMSDSQRADLCASFQRAVVSALILKLGRALDRAERIHSVFVGGGVCANSRLRRELADLARRRGLTLIIPPQKYCVDNAAMIAGLAHERIIRGEADDLSLAASPSGAV